MNIWQTLAEDFGKLPGVTLRCGENGNRRVWSYFADDRSMAKRFAVLAAEAGRLLGDTTACPEWHWFGWLREKRTVTAAAPLTDENGEALGQFVSWDLADAGGVSRRLAVELASDQAGPIAVAKKETPATAGASGASVNAVVLDLFHRNPESIGWSVRKLAGATGKSKTAIAECPAYTQAKLVKAQAKIDRLEGQQNLTARQSRSGKRRAVRPDEK